MNVAQEFSRVKESFRRVREDMSVLKDKITENYDDFREKHNGLVREVDELSSFVKENVLAFKNSSKSSVGQGGLKDFLDLSSEVKSLKAEISAILRHNKEIFSFVEDLRDERSEVGFLKKRVKSSELEIALLKEKMFEKDLEIKKMKDVNARIVQVLDELSSVEIDILNKRVGGEI